MVMDNPETEEVETEAPEVEVEDDVKPIETASTEAPNLAESRVVAFRQKFDARLRSILGQVAEQATKEELTQAVETLIKDIETGL